MENLIEKIYKGELDVLGKRPRRASGYRKVQRGINAYVKEVANYMGKAHGECLENAIIDLEELVGRDHFILGFQWGAKMMLSILGDEPDTFGYQCEQNMNVEKGECNGNRA